MDTVDRSRRGLTLVELLVALAVLGTLAAVVVPRLSDGDRAAREVGVANQLSLVRESMEHYRVMHEGLLPDERLVEQLTGVTETSGDPRAPDAPPTLLPDGTVDPGCGPYLRKPFPMNPLNGLCTVAVLDRLPAEADGTTGWIWIPRRAAFRANTPGETSHGVRYLDL